jgi:hypothetical protein
MAPQDNLEMARERRDIFSQAPLDGNPKGATGSENVDAPRRIMV